jgi:hypothetical protein
MSQTAQKYVREGSRELRHRTGNSVILLDGLECFIYLEDTRRRVLLVSPRMMTSSAAHRASVTTIPQAHHAVPGIVPHLNYSYIPIISNNTFITTRLPSIVHTNLSSSHRHTVPTIGQMNIDWIIVRLVRLRRSHFKKYRQSGSVPNAV